MAAGSTDSITKELGAQRAVMTSQGEITYWATAAGSGGTLVLLPGFQSQSTSWADRGYLRLLQNYSVLAIDPLGHGKSARSGDEADYTAECVVGHVTSVLDDAGIDQAVIWGFSRGGLIAAMCGESVPDRCSAVIMGGAPIGRARALTQPLLDVGEPFLAAGDWEGYWREFPVPLPQQLMDAFALSNDPQSCAAIIRAMRSWATEVPNMGLNPTGVPTLAYFGTGEVFADALRSSLIDTPVTAHEGSWAGHAETMIDAAGVVEVVLTFLDSLPA